MLVNTGKQISSPKVNQVVFYQPWQGKTDNRKKPYPIIIKDGEYLDSQYGRLSNFWSWHRLTPTGRINPRVESGYGNFFIAEGYQVETKVTVLK